MMASPRNFQAVKKHLPEYLQRPMTFACLTGWRTPSEILTLEWKQVDFSAGTVRLEPATTKNDEGRVFPFAVLPALAELLRKQWARTMDYQFTTGQAVKWAFHRKGRPIKDFRKAWNVACKAAGVPERTPHDFRRTAVRNLERAGVPRSVAIKLTRHKTESVYRRYAIVSEADLSEGLKKLALLHEGERKPRTVTEPLQLEQGKPAAGAVMKWRKPLICGAGGRDRTGTGLSAHGILRPP